MLGERKRQTLKNMKNKTMKTSEFSPITQKLPHTSSNHEKNPAPTTTKHAHARTHTLEMMQPVNCTVSNLDDEILCFITAFFSPSISFI